MTEELDIHIAGECVTKIYDVYDGVVSSFMLLPLLYH